MYVWKTEANDRCLPPMCSALYVQVGVSHLKPEHISLVILAGQLPSAIPCLHLLYAGIIDGVITPTQHLYGR